MVLKSVLNLISGKPENIELTSDTLITLSQIVSGCLFVPYNESVLMIIKDSTHEIEKLLDYSDVRIKTELIERPEFPNIVAYIKFGHHNDESYNYEYYFNVESSEELELFRLLAESKKLETVFYDETTSSIKRIKVDDKDRALMSTVYQKAVHMFDKA